MSNNNNLLDVRSYNLLGADIGNSFAKTTEGVILATSVSGNYGADFIENAHDVIWREKKWKVGDPSGISFTDNSKYDMEEYQVTLLTSIALSSDTTNIEIDILGLGTPAEAYDSCKAKCKESALALKEETIIVDGVTYNIKIHDVLVMPQSVIIESDSDYPCMIYDFGGGTFDVSIWNKNSDGKIVKAFSKTLPEYSFDKVIENFKTILSNEKNMSLSYNDAIDLIDNPIQSTIVSEINVKKEVDELLNGYVSRIKSTLSKLNMPINTVKQLYIIGGCAKTLSPIVIKVNGFNENLVKTPKQPQFTNAVAYYKICEEVLNQRLEEQKKSEKEETKED